MVSTSTAKKLYEAAKDARTELNELHRHFYSKCEGGCPAEVYIEALDEAIREYEGGEH